MALCVMLLDHLLTFAPTGLLTLKGGLGGPQTVSWLQIVSGCPTIFRSPQGGPPLGCPMIATSPPGNSTAEQ